MALWGKTDVADSKPKYLNPTDKANAVFVSTEEAQKETNRKKGIRGPGWWLLTEHLDSTGEIRYKAECLVACSVATLISGDAADDAKVADVEVTLTIGTQPASATAVDGAATFTIGATASSGNVTYQWQKAPAGSFRFNNIPNETTNTLALTGLVVADNGTKYRVMLGSDSGAVKATSSTATLTVTA